MRLNIKRKKAFFSISYEETNRTASFIRFIGFICCNKNTPSIFVIFNQGICSFCLENLPKNDHLKSAK